LYVKRVVVKKQGQAYAYLRLVEGYREGRRVRERVLLNLGREDKLKVSGQLEHLAAAFARADPPMLGVRREVGPLLLVKHYLERLGLAQIIEHHLPSHGRSHLTNAEVVTALIANRLAAPSPLYDISGWASSAALQELFGIPAMLLNDDRLGRLLDDFQPHSEAIRGAAALAAIEHFGVDAGRLHLDMTSLRVCGAYEDSSLVAKGWDHQHQTMRQVKVMEATTALGLSLYVRPAKGNASETSTVAETLERLAKLLLARRPGLLICTDASFGYIRHLCTAHRAGLKFVVPLRDVTGFRDLYRDQVGKQAMRTLDYVAHRQQELPPERRTIYKGCLRQLPVEDPQTGESYLFRVAYIWSSEEEQTVREARQRALNKAEKELEKVRRGLGSYYKEADQVHRRVSVILAGRANGLIHVQVSEREGKPNISWHRNEDAIAAASSSDGIYALATNLPGQLTADALLRIYKEQSLVELRHRDFKGHLRVRPIFLHNDDRIEALVSIVGLALLIFGLVELDLREQLGSRQAMPRLLPEGRSARPTGRNIFNAFQGLGLTYTSQGIRLDRLTATQRQILNRLRIPLPWPEQPAVC
jgi:transposase